ncbi:MAG: hypothetical protein EHM40_13510 [Chloroflexi bacterium]|nr:MAG: hypothetical protein EHM40_13510 [Chloroflexota bacterium]
MKMYFPLAVLVVVNLIIGLLIVPGFGESMDELSQHWYGERAINVAKWLFDTGTLPTDSIKEERPRQGSHGPAFMVIVVTLRGLLLPGGTAVEKVDFSHYLYFVMFQVGMVSLFYLARRWVSEAAAFGTVLLYCTQPLLVGHAFMNPKDVVFMSFLIISAVLGLRMLDHDEEASLVTGRPLSDAIRSFFKQFLRGDVWLAGSLLGFSSAIRIAAPLIGVVVLAHILVTRKWQMLPRFFAYGLIALGFMFVFWPYLWADPIGRLVQSMSNSVRYPDLHLTLFRGALAEARNTPLSYLPVLLPVQLTETTLILLLVGTVAVLKKFRLDLVALILTWFVLPVTAIVGMRVNLYDNFRQVFFILPPLFLIAGFGLDWLLTLLRRPVIYYLLLLLILLPGLYANITLYPYQYIYYNQMVGGLRGAYRVFEMDYWHLAFREAQVYINENADLNANVFAGGTKQSAQRFARQDLVFNAFGGKRRDWKDYDYIIVSTAENEDEEFVGYPTVFVVERLGVPLVYVKKPR